jgi:hypothetical protein
MRRELAWIGNDRVRLGLLLLILVALAAYAGASWRGLFTDGGEFAAGANCPAAEARGAAMVSRAELADLREGIQRVVFFDRRLRPYEEGVVAPIVAWSDAEPGARGSLPAGESMGGYEMRWWMPSGDDVVADGFVFAGRDEARAFFAVASEVACRPNANALKATLPPGGRNLSWRNPDGFMQEDLFLLRGRRVYRVAVVRPGSARRSGRLAEGRAFGLVGLLACALPRARCPGGRTGALVSA